MKNLYNTKITFCPGPGAVIPEWFDHQKEFFGRGDPEYDNIKKKTFSWLKKKCGQDNIIAVPGAATTASIVAINSFIEKNVLVIDTGFYSERWLNYLKKTKIVGDVKSLKYEDFLQKKISNKYKWVIFVYVETALCKKFDIKKVKKKCKRLDAKLFVDATASVGLEKNHEYGDVVFFSSCKGLFGPTGLGFIGYKKNIKAKRSSDFLLDYKSHEESKYTLGYNCMAALYSISKRHNFYKSKILFAHKYISKYLISKNHPMIGSGLKYKLKKKKLKNTIFYIPRQFPGYDLIFFLGLIKLNFSEIKKILNNRIIKNLDL